MDVIVENEETADEEEAYIASLRSLKEIAGHYRTLAWSLMQLARANSLLTGTITRLPLGNNRRLVDPVT